MQTIELDASGWKTSLDAASALKAALGSPAWHGNVAVAFVDSMVAGRVNVLKPPYLIKIVNTSDLPPEVIKFIRDVSDWVEDTRKRRLLRIGEDVPVSVEIAS